MSTPDGGHRANATSTHSPATIVVMLGAVLILGLLGAGVALALAHWTPESIIGLLGGLGTIAGVLLAALGKLATLGDKVDQVAHQTNGALRSFVADQMKTSVRKEVRSALTDHGLPARADLGERTRALPTDRPTRKRPPG